MTTKSEKSRPTKGQILLGILIAIGIFMILASAVFTLVKSSFELVSFNRARITGRHLAQEKIELIRNLVYADIGTASGIPSGILPQQENISRNGLNFLVKTDVVFIDDPFDGVAPLDTAPEDYKRARIEVSWEGIAASRRNPIVLLTDISANSTGTTDGGTLVILVFNANGQPVSQAQVTIVANSINPPVNLTLNTDSEGEVTLPGATPCIECYQITVTKAGMSTDRTYSTSEVTNPIKPHASVFIDDVAQVSFAIDTLATLNISSRDSRENGFVALGNVSFSLRGNKIIGTNALAQPVYKYDQTLSTDAGGNKNLNNMEWDIYTISMPAITSYDISGTSPLLPLVLSPGGTLDFTFSVAPHTDHSYFVTIKNPSQTLIASASARLYNLPGYDQTKLTGASGDPDFGQVLFSGLLQQNYQILATSSGYLDFNGNVDVSGYTVGEVVLSP